MKRLNASEFIDRARKKHGNRYDYSSINYIASYSNINIICLDHGEFSQRPDHHLNGSGCPICKKNKIRLSRTLPVENFISGANNKHKNIYDYSKTIYVNMKTPIIIICPIHGEFQQTPDAHIHGSGCQRCAIHNNHLLSRLTIDEFKRRAKERHGDMYIYDECVWVNYKEKMPIICKIHGKFYQNASNHLTGKGCPICRTISTSENYILTLLRNEGVSFTYQKSFPDLINPITNRKYRFDFYLDDQNTVIEFDGKHHYEEVTFYNNENGLAKVKYSDSIKNSYCVDNEIKLIRIPFTENIKTRLIEEKILTPK